MENMNYDNDYGVTGFKHYLYFWLGDEDSLQQLASEIKQGEPDATKQIENRIRTRLYADQDFFKEALDFCYEDFVFYLRQIHEPEDEGISPDEWEENYSMWTHIKSVDQVIYEYLGIDEVYFLIPLWMCELLESIFAEEGYID